MLWGPPAFRYVAPRMNPEDDRPHDDHHPETVSRNARVGLWLFAVYLLLYAGFMVLNAFFPHQMAAAPMGGVNLAVLYGLLLILSAFVLALVYVFLVRRRADDSPTGPDDARGGR
jgi:uncharacterized membrane protein (DUF485 family)